MYKVPGRAYTSEEKRAVCDAIFEAWKDAPHQRLGQLIDNAIFYAHKDPRCCYDLFSVEDDSLVRAIVESVVDHPTIKGTEEEDCSKCGFPHTAPCNPNA